MLLRVFGNYNAHCVSNGSLAFNGTGKFSSITPKILNKIKELSVTHIWYTGVIEHATCADYSQYGIKLDDPLLVKGLAGSPYAIKDYYDVNPYLADDIEHRMDEFKALIERTHNAGIKVIIDFVPNHLARNYNSDSKYKIGNDFGFNDCIDNLVENQYSSGFNPSNDFYYLPCKELDTLSFTQNIDPEQKSLHNELIKEGKISEYREFPAKVTGNNAFTASPSEFDWWDTVKLNYGIDYNNYEKKYFYPIKETWIKLYNILKFWLSIGCDGFRCDMVEMVPVEFWHWVIELLKQEYPDAQFIAEIYNKNLYDSYINYGGFDYLYDKEGLYDNLKAISQTFNNNNSIRQGRLAYAEASEISKCWQSLGNLQNKMLNFLENHDEQRIASDFNLADPFKAIPELCVSLMLNTSPFMLYFGQEYGERGMLSEGYSKIDGRTSIFDFCIAPSIQRALLGKLFDNEKKLYDIYCKLTNTALNKKAISCGEMFDLEYANFNNTSFDTKSQFAFARYYKSNSNLGVKDAELIIISVDFNYAHNTTNLFISPILPQHFFSFCGICNGLIYKAIDLLNNNILSVELNSDAPILMPKNEYGISILEIKI